MKKETEKSSVRSSTRTLVLFCVVVSLVILASLFYRVFLLVKNSKFDGSSGFIVSILQEDRKKAVIYAFDPALETVSVVTLMGETPLPNLRQTYGIPISGEIKKREVESKEGFPFEIASYSLYNPNKNYDISLLDSLRLWYLSKTAGYKHTRMETVNLFSGNTALDNDVTSLLIDSQLEKDKKSITIVNGTAIGGLGGRLEKMISVIGGSVISVTTSHDQITHSKIIYYGDKSYTLGKLEKMIPFPLEHREGTALSDIIVEIGEDAQRTELF